MADTAYDSDSVERAVNIDVQYSVSGIAPQLRCCNFLTVAKVVKISNRPQLGNLFKKPVASGVNRG